MILEANSPNFRRDELGVGGHSCPQAEKGEFCSLQVAPVHTGLPGEPRWHHGSMVKLVLGSLGCKVDLVLALSHSFPGPQRPPLQNRILVTTF